MDLGCFGWGRVGCLITAVAGIVLIVKSFDATLGFEGEGPPWIRLTLPRDCPSFTVLIDWHGVCDALSVEDLVALFGIGPVGSRLDWLVCFYGGRRRMIEARLVLDAAGWDCVPIV